MEWSRVKNVLIVLLVIVNLFLFLVHLGITMNDVKDNEELVIHTVNVLERNGITVDSDVIPVGAPELYPATATFFEQVGDVIVTEGRFTLNVDGDIEKAAKTAGITVAYEGKRLYQTVNYSPIYNGGAYYDKISITGLAIKSVENLKSDAPQSICGLLVAASEWLPSGKILSIKQGYFYNRTGDDTAYLFPVWQISYKDSVYYINAMNGEAAS